MTTDEPSGDSAERLLRKIIFCQDVSAACSDGAHPCHHIVNYQEREDGRYRQSPEPWAGSITAAPLMYLASNPSISSSEITGEDYPRVSFGSASAEHPMWPDHRVVDFHTNRFDQSRERPFVNPKAQFLCRDGEHRGSDGDAPGKGSQKYWSSAFRETAFILGHPVDIGRDLCLTEVVHCKTKSENDPNRPTGLTKARPRCVSNYLDAKIDVSGAVLIVVVGAQARDAITDVSLKSTTEFLWDIDEVNFGRFKSRQHFAYHVGVVSKGGKHRILVALRHLSDGRNGFNTFAKALGDQPALRLGELVRGVIAGSQTVPDSRQSLIHLLSR